MPTVTQEVILTINNRHGASSGKAPSIDTEGKYVSYFPNAFGEQWVFVGDRQRLTATLYGGDIGWEFPQHLSMSQMRPTVVMNDPEMVWLLACWCAFTHKSVEEVQAAWNR